MEQCNEPGRPREAKRAVSENERSLLELEEEPFHSLTDLLKHVHVGQLCRGQQVADDRAADWSEMKVKGSAVTPSWTVWSFNYEQDVLSSPGDGSDRHHLSATTKDCRNSEGDTLSSECVC